MILNLQKWLEMLIVMFEKWVGWGGGEDEKVCDTKIFRIKNKTYELCKILTIMMCVKYKIRKGARTAGFLWTPKTRDFPCQLPSVP